MPPSLSHIATVWKTYWNTTVGRVQIIFTLVLAVWVCWFHTHYLTLLESRHGATFDDRIILYLQPIDFSIPLFVVLYSVVFIGLYFLLDDPPYLIRAAHAYALMMVLRTISIYFTPLEAPHGMIMLIDPIGQALMRTHGEFITKDLFFSGHTATVFIYYFALRHRWMKYYVALCCILVPIMLVWQHVHYTSDVLAAPVAAYFCVKVSDTFYNKFPKLV